MATRTEREWEERFGGALDNGEGSTFHETYGEEMERVRAADPMTVWSIYEADNENQYLIPGFHAVNIIGFVLSEKPITQEELDSHEWDEVMWIDYEEFRREAEQGGAPDGPGA